MQSGKLKCFSSSLPGHSIRTATMFFCSATATLSSAKTQGRVSTPLVSRITKLEDLRTALSNSSRSRNSHESKKSKRSASNWGSSCPLPARRFRSARTLGGKYSSSADTSGEEVDAEERQPCSLNSSLLKRDFGSSSCELRQPAARETCGVTMGPLTGPISPGSLGGSTVRMLSAVPSEPKFCSSSNEPSLSTLWTCVVVSDMLTLLTVFGSCRVSVSRKAPSTDSLMVRCVLPD
mmetsp:Transcript_38315/g.106781  ORF Transcript_38315/g.106781 Transcript_38315/m.106781 type:complete len:235 (-) Transcript_38315:640-1344(-)